MCFDLIPRMEEGEEEEEEEEDWHACDDPSG